MPKIYTTIGFDDPQEVSPGVWKGEVERHYYADVLRNNRALQNSDAGTNDNITISNQISIVADPYANGHIYAMKWLEFQGAKWKITNVEVAYPRLTLTLGGLYNENSD